MADTVQEPLRDRVGRILFEEPGTNADWYALSEERREPWRKDADRAISLIAPEHQAVIAERDRAQKLCAELIEKLTSPDPFR